MSNTTPAQLLHQLIALPEFNKADYAYQIAAVVEEDMIGEFTIPAFWDAAIQLAKTEGWKPSEADHNTYDFTKGHTSISIGWELTSADTWTFDIHGIWAA